MIRRYHFHDTRYTHHTSTPFHGTSPVQLGVLFYLIFSNYDWICDLPFADLAGSLADLDSAARHGVVGGLIICCFDYDGWKARGKGACFGANWSKGVEGGSVSIVVERGLTYFWLKEWELKWERGARKGGYGTDKESMIVDQDWSLSRCTSYPRWNDRWSNSTAWFINGILHCGFTSYRCKEESGDGFCALMPHAFYTAYS